MRSIRLIHAICLTAVLAVLTCSATGQSVTAYVGARFIPIDGPEIERGTLIVENGRISEIGPQREVRVPRNARVIDVAGKVIMPGLICTHSHIGGIGGADRAGPIQPDVRVYDSINVRDSGFRRAVAGGLTTLNIMSGSGHLLSGQTVYVKLRGAAGESRKIDDLFIYDEEGEIMGGIKMANGTNPMRDAPWPGTRGKAASLMRQQFIRAQEYRDKVQQADGDAKKMPKRDIGLEAMMKVLDGKWIVHHHTHRHDDIMTVLRLAEEFNFRVVLHHVSDGWKVADEIAAAGVPVSAIIVDSPGGKLEAIGLSWEVGAALEQAGVLTAFHTDDYITDSRIFFRMAALAVRGGMSREGALKSLTLAGAKMLDLDHRIGSLTPGKDADFVILDGDPLSVYTKVLETYVEGKKVFDRNDSQDHLYAVGGYGAGHDQSPYFCCFGYMMMFRGGMQ